MVATAKAGARLIVRNPRIQGGEPTIRGTRVPVRSIVIARGHVERGDITEAQLDAALDVLAMTRPG